MHELRMREELDLEFKENRHLFDPLVMKDPKKGLDGEPDLWDRL